MQKIQKIILIAIISLVVSFNLPVISVAQALEPPTAPTPPPPASTYEEPAPTPPPASTYEEPAPPPPEPTYEESATSEEAEADSSVNSQSSSSQTPSGSDEYSGTEAVNSGNGSGSENESDVDGTSETTIDSSNTAGVNNTIGIEVVTGDNSSSRNTGGVSSVTTGDATAAITVETGVNSTTISGSGCCSGSLAAENLANGSDSENLANVTSTNTETTTIDNDADIQTEIVGLALTGDNDASRNVGDSAILTGDANLAATVITDANTTALGVYSFDVNGNQTGDLILGEFAENCVNCGDGSGILAENLGNGADSENLASADSSNTTTETITNEADVVNNITLTANSGDNSADRNTGGDSTITTGDANVAANVVNTLNTIVSGVIYTVNVFGSLVGNIILPDDTSSNASCSNCCGQNITAANSDNGSESQNSATVTSDNTTTTTQNNNALITNNLDLDGNTGDNEASFNTAGDSIIDTGEVDISANTLNVANLNVSGSACDSPIHLVLVNNLGQWVGQILGAPAGSYYYGSDGIIYLVGPNGELIATNSGNGAGSTNTASVTSTNNTSITQTNNANLANNINIQANTGNNSTSRNTGGNNSITTGDANIALNLINFVNSNFSGRKVILTLVNIFGSLFGDIVPPGQTANAQEDQEQSADDQDQDNGDNDDDGDDGDDNNGDNQEPDQDEEEQQGEILATTFGKFKGGQEVVLSEEESEGNDDVANEIVQTAGGFNWRWLLLAAPLPIIWLLWKRQSLAKLLRR